MGFKLASRQHRSLAFELGSHFFHPQTQQSQQDENQETVLRNLSALSMFMNTRLSSDSGQCHDLLRNTCQRSRPLSGQPSLVSSSLQPSGVFAFAPTAPIQSQVFRLSDPRVCVAHSSEDSDACQSGSASSTSFEGFQAFRVDSLQSPGTPARRYGNDAACPNTFSSSPSLSGSQDDSSDIIEAAHGNSDMDTDAEAESAFGGGRSFRASGRTLSQRRSLSSHFFGKSRSFTSLGDVTAVQSIQDLAKPDNPYPKRRGSLQSSRQHRDRLRCIESSISKKGISKKGRGGSSLAVAFAGAEGEAWGMEP